MTTVTAPPAADLPPGLDGLRILVGGLFWPPETFLDRLFRRLMGAGAELTIATASTVEAPYRWLPVPGSYATNATVARALPARLAEAGHDRDQAKELWSRTARWSGSLRVQRFQQFLAVCNAPVDVVYFPWVGPAELYAPILDLLPPVVVSCRGAQVSVAPWNPDRASFRAGLADVFAKATRVHAVSEAIVEDAVELGLDRAKAVVVRPGADTSLFAVVDRDRRPSTDRFTVATTGSLIWRKGLEYLVSSIARLAADGVDVVLDVIGEGRDRARLVAAARDLGVADRVRLLGRLPSDEVRDRLGAADAFVLPSLSEGISNAVLEAMAMGLPVVTTDCGGMAEVVDDGIEGFVVPVRDAAAMATALGRLAADADLRARMGDAGRARIAGGLTADVNAAGIARIFVEAGAA